MPANRNTPVARWVMDAHAVMGKPHGTDIQVYGTFVFHYLGTIV